MGPKRRYQCSTVLGGIPSKPLPSSPPEYFSNLNYSYSQPITPAQIAVNPCLSSKKITTSSHPPQKTNQSSSSKGNRTYRVKAHHQNHYELPVVHPPPTPAGGGGDARGGDSSRPSTATNMALSQGIFGLPIMQEYFSCSPEDYLDNQRPPPSPPPPPKPRMRTTLPSSSSSSSKIPPPPEVTGNSFEEGGIDGILQVRPASRSRTRPELNGGGGGCGFGRRSQPQRRRAQSSIPEGVIKLFPEEEDEEPSHLSHHPHLQKPSGDLWDTILGKLRCQDADWEEILDGFQMISRWVGSKWPAGFLKKVIWAGLPHLASQRTKLSRAACQCFKVLYEMGGRGTEGMGIGDGDRVFQRLLDLCGGTSNKFIREESKGALLAAVENLEAGKVLGLLETWGAKHRNGQVKEYAAWLLGRVVDRLGVERVVGGKEYAARVIPMIVGFLMEAGLQTRINAKSCLSKIYMHPEFQAKLRRYIPAQNIRSVQETLKKMQMSGGGGSGGGLASGSASQQIHPRRSSAKWN